MDIQVPVVRDVASGSGWRIRDINCRAKVGEPDFEECHERHVIAVVKRGVFSYHGKGGKSLIHGGALLVGNAGRCYSCGHHHSDGDQCLALQLDNALYAEVASSAARNMAFEFVSGLLPLHHELFSKVVLLEAAMAGNNAILKDEAVLNLIEAVLMTAAQSSSAITSLPYQTRKIATTVAFMEHHASEKISLQQLADLAQLSRYHFLRVFKQSVGMTPHQFLLRTRLKLAVQLLSTTKLPVIEVALLSGFDDLSTFNRTFKTQTGKTPRMLRH